jgi:hypothetical protein
VGRFGAAAALVFRAAGRRGAAAAAAAAVLVRRFGHAQRLVPEPDERIEESRARRDAGVRVGIAAERLAREVARDARRRAREAVRSEASLLAALHRRCTKEHKPTQLSRWEGSSRAVV